MAGEASSAVRRRFEGAKRGLAEMAVLGLLAPAEGRTDSASRYLAQAKVIETTDGAALMDLAELESLLGRTQDALATIQRARAAGYSDFFFPVIIPGFQPIRNAPELRALFSPSR